MLMSGQLMRVTFVYVRMTDDEDGFLGPTEYSIASKAYRNRAERIPCSERCLR